MIVTPNTLPPEVQTRCDDVLLSVRTPRLIHNTIAMRKHLPAKSGNTLRMPRYDRLPTFPVPLGGSGQTPPSTNLNRVDIDATISFYGYLSTAVIKSALIEVDPVVAFSWC